MTELLKNQRKYVKGRITYFLNTVTRGDLALSQLNTIDKHIRNLYARFENLQDKIEEIDATEVDKNDREEFENNYCNLEARLLEKISDICDKKPQNESNHKALDYTPKCRLPEIELPKFDGKYSSWITFKEDFDNLIHRNQEIANIDKFRYLLSCLQGGTAYSIVEFIPRTNLNYELAWQRLIDNFDNESIILKN